MKYKIIGWSLIFIPIIAAAILYFPSISLSGLFISLKLFIVRNSKQVLGVLGMFSMLVGAFFILFQNFYEDLHNIKKGKSNEYQTHL
jgi:hypothetical protein